MNKEIGGYFELELRYGSHYHPDAIRLNSARHAFEYVLQANNYRKVYIPYFTCEVMLQPIHRLGVEVEYYHIDQQLEPNVLPTLAADEAFVYTNYFGLKQAYVECLSQHYRHGLIIDNSQAFFAPHVDGIDTFYSARKFLGVADGAYLYTNKILDIDIPQDKSFSRMQHLLQRIDEGASAAYSIFHKNDESLSRQPILRMSALTERILCSIDYDAIRFRRQENFRCLDHHLSSSNLLQFTPSPSAVPMAYPYLTADPTLRQRLISNKIFVATYWPNVLNWCTTNDLEYQFTQNIIPLPIDQRYNAQDMKTIAEFTPHHNTLINNVLFVSRCNYSLFLIAA